MNLDHLRGHWLSSVVLRTDRVPGEAIVVLVTETEEVTLRLVGIVHARVDIADPKGDFVDEISVRELPKDGSWPAEARHLLHRHVNGSALQWLVIVGPSEVEVLAESFSVE